MLRLQLSEKENAMRQAKELLAKYRRLFNSPGSGGISKKEFMEKENEAKRAEAAYKQTYAQLDDLELTFSQQYLSNSQKIEQLRLQIIQSQLQYDQKKNQIDRLEKEVNMKYLAAVEAWKAASKINFSDLDDNNFLVIRAPVSGEVSAVWYRQAGEKVSPSTPLLAISPKNAGKVLLLSIPDRDRALLAVGQPVKVKFHAFPYQRFGFLSGELEFLSNSATVTKEGRSLYKGRVKLDKDYYEVNGKKLPIRFGMNANVEIVVQRRRVLDFALDPFRKLVKN
jgi:HlyD family secretion protein